MPFKKYKYKYEDEDDNNDDQHELRTKAKNTQSIVSLFWRLLFILCIFEYGKKKKLR